MTNLLLLAQYAGVDPELTAKLLERYRLWMTVSAVGELLWVPAYVLLLLAGKRDKTNPMPILALWAAVPLNFMFSFVCDETNPSLCPHTPHGNSMDVASLWIWRLCLLFSLIALWQYFTIGRDHPQDVNVPPRVAVPTITVGLVLSFAFQFSFLLFELDFNGNQLYFMLTVLISGGFVLFALARPESRGHSYAAGWLRLLGEALMVLGVVVITAKAGSSRISLYPGYEHAPHAFVYIISATIVLLDITYVAILMRRRRMGAPVLRTSP